VVVGVDVVGDLLSCLGDGLPLAAPGAAALELAEPGVDERLGLGVAVAAAAMRDAPGGQVLPDVTRNERDPLSVPSVSTPGQTPWARTAASTLAIASSDVAPRGGMTCYCSEVVGLAPTVTRDEAREDAPWGSP